jgi:hypothetical protein
MRVRPRELVLRMRQLGRCRGHCVLACARLGARLQPSSESADVAAACSLI